MGYRPSVQHWALLKYLVALCWKMWVFHCGSGTLQSYNLKNRKGILWIFFFFGCARSLLLCGLCSGCERGLLSLANAVGLSLWWLLLLRSTGFRARGLSGCSFWALSRAQWSWRTDWVALCLVARGIFPDQALKLCLLHCQADWIPYHWATRVALQGCLIQLTVFRQMHF